MKNFIALILFYILIVNINAQSPPTHIEIISYPDTIKTTDTLTFQTTSLVFTFNLPECSPLHQVTDSLKSHELLFDLTFDFTGNWASQGCYRLDTFKFPNPPKGNLTLISFISYIVYPGTSSELQNNRYGSDTVTIYVEDPTGIEENKSIKFRISPNPVRDHIKIEQLQNSRLEQIEIWDMNGRKVREVNQNFKSIDLSELDSGVYLLRMISEGASENFKIVKQ